mgnify:CR=1 FL=1
MWYVIQVMSGEEHEKEQLFKKLILNRDGRTYDKIFVPMYSAIREDGTRRKRSCSPAIFLLIQVTSNCSANT